MITKYTIIIILLISLLPTQVRALTNLNVPFTSQAPGGNWVEPWQNACEETSILMVDAFYQQYTFGDISPSQGILNVFFIKHSYYQPSLDEDASTIVSMINNFFPWEAFIVENPSLTQIKNEIDAGRPVIVPAYGKGLKNPYFQLGGPTYHVFIISGYDNDTQEFIAQEPGTSFGFNYRYPYTRVLDAIHDFLPNNKTPKGAKRVIFTKPSIDESADLDGDNDGANKLVEIAYGTHLFSPDTDNDGYSDGMEINQGFSPRLNETALLYTGGLIKGTSSPQVYSLVAGKKHYIVSEDAFKRHNFKWRDLIVTSDKFINSIKSGNDIN